MKLVYSSTLISRCRSSFSRVLFYSTETLASSTSKDTLYRRISPIGDPRVSIFPVLDQWIEEGRTINGEDLRSMIKQFRVYRRFKHALEISQWMSDKRYLDLSPADIAVRLDLISKVHGLEQAEKYFSNIPEQLRVFQVYGALLNCYTHEKSVEKTESLLQQMRELGFARTSLSYNVLLNLYSRMGQHEKLDTLMQEMEKKGILRDKFTFSIRLSAYASASDIGEMEKILKRMEMDPHVVMDWNAYAVAANGYIKAGLLDEALAMLKKSEELVSGKKKRVAFDYLLTLYAGTGKRDELYRLWNLYKRTDKVYNSTYMCMIGSLVKLDDIDGAEKILEEWESGDTSYDIRVLNCLISAYCKKGLLEKAEVIINKVIERGKKPSANTWNHLANGYLEDNQMQKAVEMMKNAILASRPGWKPNIVTLVSCLEYLKEKGDVDGAEEFVRLQRALGPISVDVSDRLVNSIEDGKLGSTLDQIEGDGLGADGETHGVLESR